jgi:hypothetical protein
MMENNAVDFHHGESASKKQRVTKAIDATGIGAGNGVSFSLCPLRY